MTTKSRDANIINLELGTVSHSLSMDRFFFFLGSWFGHIHYMCVSICDGEREREREPESSSIQSSPYHITSQSDFQSTECNWCRNIVSLLLFFSSYRPSNVFISQSFLLFWLLISFPFQFWVTANILSRTAIYIFPILYREEESCSVWLFLAALVSIRHCLTYKYIANSSMKWESEHEREKKEIPTNEAKFNDHAYFETLRNLLCNSNCHSIAYKRICMK